MLVRWDGRGAGGGDYGTYLGLCHGQGTRSISINWSTTPYTNSKGFMDGRASDESSRMIRWYGRSALRELTLCTMFTVLCPLWYSLVDAVFLVVFEFLSMCFSQGLGLGEEDGGWIWMRSVIRFRHAGRQNS